MAVQKAPASRASVYFETHQAAHSNISLTANDTKNAKLPSALAAAPQAHKGASAEHPTTGMKRPQHVVSAAAGFPVILSAGLA